MNTIDIGMVYFFEVVHHGVVISHVDQHVPEMSGQAIFAMTQTEAEIRLKDLLSALGPSEEFTLNLLR